MAGDDEPVIVQENANRAANIGQEIDYNHPLFLSPSDVSRNQTISFQLTGMENYTIWFRSMCIALLGRNKLGMVDGSCDKEKYSENLWNHWDWVDAVVQSWLNDSYNQARSQILLMSPLPSINQAYAMVMGDESQRSVPVWMES